MLFTGFANSLTAARLRFRAETLTSRHTILHRLYNNASDLFGSLGKVRVTGGGPVPPVLAQLADERKVLAGHDRMVGCGVAEVMNPQLPELRIATNHPPASDKIMLMPALGVFRK